MENGIESLEQVKCISVNVIATVFLAEELKCKKIKLRKKIKEFFYKF